MAAIKEHLDAILAETNELAKDHAIEVDELAAVEEIRTAARNVELAVHEARKAFAKKIEER